MTHPLRSIVHPLNKTLSWREQKLSTSVEYSTACSGGLLSPGWISVWWCAISKYSYNIGYLPRFLKSKIEASYIINRRTFQRMTLINESSLGNLFIRTIPDRVQFLYILMNDCLQTDKELQKVCCLFPCRELYVSQFMVSLIQKVHKKSCKEIETNKRNNIHYHIFLMRKIRRKF